MKKLLIAVMLIGMISSCTEPTVNAKQTVYTVPKPTGDASLPLSVVVIEGCEYFVCSNHYGPVITHKGNCNNPIHPEYKRR